MKLALIGAALCALALSGCAQLTADINNTRDWLSSPATTQAAANLKAGAQAIVCDVSSLAALDQKINAAIDAGQAIDRDVNTIYTVSSILCTSLGGTPVGTAIVPPTAQ